MPRKRPRPTNGFASSNSGSSRWKRIWKAATFDEDEKYFEELHEGEPVVEAMLEEFGAQLIKLGTRVWDAQAEGLAKAPFMKK